MLPQRKALDRGVRRPLQDCSAPGMGHRAAKQAGRARCCSSRGFLAQVHRVQGGSNCVQRCGAVVSAAVAAARGEEHVRMARAASQPGQQDPSAPGTACCA